MSEGATFLSEVCKKIKEGAILAEERAGAIANAYMNDCIKMAENARSLEAAAIQNMDTAAANLYKELANSFDKKAAERLAMSAEEYVAKTSAAAKVGLSYVGELAGPVFDAIQMANGAFKGWETGDYNDLGAASTAVLGQAAGAMMGGLLVDCLVSAGLMTAAVGAGAGIVVGLAAVTVGYVASEYAWPWLRDLLKDAVEDTALMAQVVSWGLDKYLLNNDFIKDFLANQLEAGNSLLDKLVSEFDTLRKSGIKFATKFHFVTPGYCDPLMLDLDGDGIETKSIGTANVKFDMDKDGFAEKVGWIAPDDGFLALDRNGNGTIDDISELFGKETVSGFDELKQQDVNADGRIDANDAVYANLKVWRDLNGNGVSDAGELQSMADVGIASISLNNQSADTLTNGNIISHTGSFTRTDGTTGTVADVNLQTNQTYTCYKGGFTFDSELLTLPWLRGFGEVAALPIAADGYDYEIRRMA